MENPAEVQELRNKLRMMKFPQDEILNTVRRQQRAIHKQKQANETIRNEITEYETQIAHLNHLMELHETSEELQRLRSQQKSLSSQFSALSADFSAEEQRRKKLEDEVSRANSKAGGLYKQSRENEDLQARLRTMENRLDKALLKYNNSLTTLADLRSQIDELRKDRFSFQSAMAKAEADLKEADTQMATLISASNEAYSERDRMKMALVNLRNAEKEDQATYDQEMARLTATIDNQKANQNRPHETQQIVSESSSQIGSATDQQEEMTQQTDMMQTTNQRTLDLLEMKDTNELFETAEALERENFSLFNFVVEHGANKTRLQEELDGLEMQLEDLQHQSEMSEKDQADELDKLTTEITELDEDLESVTKQKQHNEAEFQAVYSGIGQIFGNLECNWEEAPDEKTEVTQANAMFCLSSVEAKVADLMNEIVERAKRAHQEAGNDLNALVQNESVQNRSVSNAPKTGDKSSDATKQHIVESSKPLSIEEMMALIE